MKKIEFTDLKNNLDCLVSVLTPFVDKVEVSEPIGDDYSEVVKSYDIAEWKKGFHRVGSTFYGYDDLLEMSAKFKYNEHGMCIGSYFDGLQCIQLRFIVSNGYGRMYCNRAVGHIIVEVCRNNRWTEYDMTNDTDKMSLANFLNDLVKETA